MHEKKIIHIWLVDVYISNTRAVVRVGPVDVPRKLNTNLYHIIILMKDMLLNFWQKW